jgi:uncharacterized repeat protein (TIGR04138 family)
MSQQQQAKEVNWKNLLNAAGPYPMEAFHFVREGLTYTSQRVHRSTEPADEVDRHISGQQLCLGLRDYAISQYGLLAPVVLAHWNVRRTDDFGRMVFAMIAEGLMSKTDNDTPEDFRAVFDFDEAFSSTELVTRMTTDIC